MSGGAADMVESLVAATFFYEKDVLDICCSERKSIPCECEWSDGGNVTA